MCNSSKEEGGAWKEVEGGIGAEQEEEEGTGEKNVHSSMFSL